MSVLNSVIAKFIETRLQALIMGQAISSVGGGGGGFGGIGKLFSSFFNFGGGGGILGGGVMPFQHGGEIKKNQASIVGEAGPELFVPHAAGTVVSNSRSSQLAGGGTTITQNFNISTGVQQTVRAEVLGMMPLIKAETNNAVLDARQRGGSFASALLG